MTNVEYPVRNDNHPRIWLSKQNMPRGFANSENRAVSLFGFNYCHVILGAKSALCLSAMMLHVVKLMVRDVHVSGTFPAILCLFKVFDCWFRSCMQIGFLFQATRAIKTYKTTIHRKRFPIPFVFPSLHVRSFCRIETYFFRISMA